MTSDGLARIVVLDDEESTRDTTCDLLVRAGYDSVGVATTLGLKKALSSDATVLCNVSPPRTFHQIVEMAHSVRAVAGDRTPIVLYGSQPALQLSILVRACAASGFIERSGDPAVTMGRLSQLGPRPRGPTKVLIVDDDEITLEVLQARLRGGGGYDVRIAFSFGEVQSIIQGWQPSVIVADVNMPDMRGDDLCARLKAAASTRDAVVVLCSSMPDVELEVAARAAGADGWVSKDRGVEQVVSCLEAVLGRPSRSQST
jgi:two-component system chemotaxis response regulator CheY